MASVSNTISARMEENRTAFIHDLFSKNGAIIGHNDVIKAWKEAGGRDKMKGIICTYHPRLHACVACLRRL